ncbi:unnamed protein product [Cylindrotheca closterium]|uniref:Uncharacterized protein n=1 Tax=Cylindrotheca closterium TaxID=2856 RepID=A0AAD2G5N6_9STRA|nr:unnamed protein product [Cylindrotheca closterium]
MSFTPSVRSLPFTLFLWLCINLLLSTNCNSVNAYLPTCPRSSKTTALGALSREDEIRRQIVKLKKQGKIRSDGDNSATSSEPSTMESYDDKIRNKLGKKKSQMLGFGGNDDFEGTEENLEDLRRIQAELDEDDDTENENTFNPRSPGQIGSLPETSPTTTEGTILDTLPGGGPKIQDEKPITTATSKSTEERKPIIDPSLFDEEQQEEMSEEDLVELVAQKLAEKARASEQKRAEEAAANRAVKMEQQAKQREAPNMNSGRTTSGVGGKWEKEDGEESSELYKPKSGSWGAFPRPRNISTAYGGGRRVGVGFSNEEDAAADVNTKKLLQDYRRKVGIDVPTEKEHAAEIEEALKIGQLAMQRGIYTTAVSALEKVTKWCSTNSKVGSQIYLELAMAYEASGRTQEAMKVYTTLTQCRMEDVKFNAKRLLYGMEAMEVMKAVSSDFSRKQIKNTFIETTGLRDIAKNFDDVYQTAYVDTEGSFYKKLTQSAVRSNREARQVLLKATGKGEVPRLRIVQALRSIARYFDDALEAEIAANTKIEPTAFIDGKPLIIESREEKDSSTSVNLDEFVLASSKQMIENLEGTWQLQLLADKTGDGVSFFNTTIATQKFCIRSMTFSASGPSGLTRVEKSGDITFEVEKRILTRSMDASSNDGGIFGFLAGGSTSGFGGAVSREQQIMSVDSVLLITKSPMGSRQGKGAEKEHFCVWRKVI